MILLLDELISSDMQKSNLKGNSCKDISHYTTYFSERNIEI